MGQDRIQGWRLTRQLTKTWMRPGIVLDEKEFGPFRGRFHTGIRCRFAALAFRIAHLFDAVGLQERIYDLAFPFLPGLCSSLNGLETLTVIRQSRVDWRMFHMR